MNRPALLALGCAIFLGTPLPVRAWDPIGHMLIARIAYDQLTPVAKVSVAAAVARFNAKDAPHDAPYDPITIACWMDDIRSRTQQDFKQYAVWHYVNLPFTPKGMPPPGPSAGPNVIWGIGKVEAIAAGDATDPSIDRDRAFAMLEHLVGDIHQPLHTTSRSDSGGNKVDVVNLKDPLISGKDGNLHYFWDSAYRRRYRSGIAAAAYGMPFSDRAQPVASHAAFEPAIRIQASALEKKYPRTILREQGGALSWAKESHVLGYRLGYGKLPSAPDGQPVRLTKSYVTAARTCAERRIALAGYRLGYLLNKIFGGAP